MEDLSKAINIIKKSEGLELKAYICPAGKITIGYGKTGPNIKMGMKWTKEQAEKQLLKDVNEFAEDVKELFPNLKGNKFQALVSFAYNVGINNLKNSTLKKKIDAKDFTSAANEFDRWVFANGKKLNGLITRRKLEKQLFLTEDK